MSNRPPIPSSWRAPAVWLLAVLSGLTGIGWGRQAPAGAELSVSGYGLLGNRQLKISLQLLEQPGHRPEFFDANFIEDAALILMSRMKRDGFLHPELTARITLKNGETIEHHWTQAVSPELLPRPLQALRVEFHIRKGVLYYFGTVQFSGLTLLSEEAAESYFVETTGLLHLKRTRIYSPDRLDRGLASLVEILNRRGYESAQATVEHLNVNDHTGQTDVEIKVHEGLKSIVRSVREEYFYDKATNAEEVVTIRTNAPYSKIWVQDLTQHLRATNYHRGYPDTKVDVTQAHRETTDDVILVDLLAQIQSGNQVWVDKVRFTGEQRTKLSLMERRVRLEEGALLDRTRVDEGRFRLARLGVFDTVGVNYEPVDEHLRDVIYDVKEGKRIDFSLLFGFGSYELLRGGVEVEQNNIWGHAHHARLRLIQSFKSSSGEYTYTMPELIGRDVDVFFTGSALRREEIDFTREEYGGGLGARKYIRPIESDVTLRYNYQVLSASAPALAALEGLQEANVGSFLTEIRHDREDNPLYPRQGYKIYGNAEIASPSLGGDANYERFEINGAYHQPLDSGRWLHFGVSHGAVFTPGNPAQDLPFNRRFFPGGPNSIRGYQEGAAAPRNALGQIVGAESYLFASMEFEQSLTPSWSVIGFFDTLGFAEKIQNYPFDQTLYSVGGGLRWKTIIGPVRLEYGYNLNPGPHDPIGTLQFALGFPF